VVEFLNSDIAVRTQGDVNGKPVWSVLRKVYYSKKYPDDHQKAGQYYKAEEWKKM
jgi:hypothetical protein